MSKESRSSESAELEKQFHKHIHFQHKSKHTVPSENKTKGGKKEKFHYRKSSNDKRRGQKKKKRKKGITKQVKKKKLLTKWQYV